MNQAELQKMADERLKDAKALIDAGRWEFAYYTVGYVVECALKSCILARMVHTGWIFEEKSEIKTCRTHEFTNLIAVAGLTDQLNADLTASSAAGKELAINWRTAKEWTSATRYQAKSELDAKRLYAAIADEPHGVLRWIRTHW